MIKPSITKGSGRVYPMKKWVLAAMTTAFAGILLVGCGDEPRKTVSKDDICTAYKAQLDGIMKDTTMTDQDRINMIPRLSGYATCAESVGTGGLTVPGAPGSADAPAANSPMDLDKQSRSASPGR